MRFLGQTTGWGAELIIMVFIPTVADWVITEP
jgi:hypothetical protein